MGDKRSELNTLVTPKSQTFFMKHKFKSPDTRIDLDSYQQDSGSNYKNLIFRSPNQGYLGIKPSTKDVKMRSYRRKFRSQNSKKKLSNTLHLNSPNLAKRSSNLPFKSLSTKGESDIKLFGQNNHSHAQKIVNRNERSMSNQKIGDNMCKKM